MQPGGPVRQPYSYSFRAPIDCSKILGFVFVFQYGLKKTVMGPGDKADHWMDRAKKRYFLFASISQKDFIPFHRTLGMKMTLIVLYMNHFFKNCTLPPCL
jgi:hypothetical protein